jgi:hypothetical protein
VIDVKTAVSKALEFMKTLFEERKLINLMLEEVELSEDNGYWLVTFGFDVPEPSGSPIGAIVGLSYRRVFKIFKVDAESGETNSMKIRTL